MLLSSAFASSGRRRVGPDLTWLLWGRTSPKTWSSHSPHQQTLALTGTERLQGQGKGRHLGVPPGAPGVRKPTAWPFLCAFFWDPLGALGWRKRGRHGAGAGAGAQWGLTGFLRGPEKVPAEKWPGGCCVVTVLRCTSPPPPHPHTLMALKSECILPGTHLRAALQFDSISFLSYWCIKQWCILHSTLTT